jgi:hypothetical protein
MSSRNPIERAIELARSGRFNAVGEIKAHLKTEQFDGVEDHLRGPGFQRQLRGEIAAARAAAAAASAERSEPSA